MRRLLAIAMVTMMSCSGAPHDATPSATEPRVDVDSMLDAIALRYESLREARKAAYAESEQALREELLRENDSLCVALDELLHHAIELRNGANGANL